VFEASEVNENPIEEE